MLRCAFVHYVAIHCNITMHQKSNNLLKLSTLCVEIGLKNAKRLVFNPPIETPILVKRILLEDNSDDYVLYHIAIAKFGNCCSMLVFPFRRRRQRTCVVLRCIFRRDFLSPHTTTALWVENYPSATVLRPLKSDF